MKIPLSSSGSHRSHFIITCSIYHPIMYPLIFPGIRLVTWHQKEWKGETFSTITNILHTYVQLRTVPGSVEKHHLNHNVGRYNIIVKSHKLNVRSVFLSRNCPFLFFFFLGVLSDNSLVGLYWGNLDLHYDLSISKILHGPGSVYNRLSI